MSKKTKPKKKTSTACKRLQRVRNAQGKLVSEDGTTRLERWNCPGILGFANWFKDIQPCILHSDGRYRPIKLTRKQGALLKKIYAVDASNNFLKSLILNIEPRRHSKSTLFALVLLHLFTSRDNWSCQLAGNSENHSRRTQYNLLVNIIRHTPKLRAMIPDRAVIKDEISYKGNTIYSMTGLSTRSAFGSRLDLIWLSDFHACVDTSYWNALQASSLDAEGSLCLVDSNVGAIDSHDHQLQQQAEADPAMFCNYTFYKNFEEFTRLAPPWINRDKAKRLEKTTLPADFKRDVLGLRSDAMNALFTDEIIQLCKSDYSTPVTDTKTLTNGRAFKVGAGVDRAKSIFGGMTGNDNTVLTVICKVARPNGEPEIFILDQQVIIPNTSRGVKKAILKAHERYHLDNITLENYEVADLAPWLDDQKIPYELVSAHEAAQTISFTEFFRIAREGRFHFPASLTSLEAEMRTFSYKLKSNNKYSFGHSQQKFKDDRVYSVNWSIFSLRLQILAPYVLGNIQCINKSNRRQFCFLFGGQHILPGCSQQCVAFGEVEDMFKQFKQYQFDSELSLPEFHQAHVRLEGCRISPA